MQLRMACFSVVDQKKRLKACDLHFMTAPLDAGFVIQYFSDLSTTSV
jgi:hypothetical protein